jgi:hypothetical protein
LKTHSWADTPLFISFNSDDFFKQKEEIAFVQTARQEYDDLPTKPAMYVVASYNKQLNNIFCKDQPDSIIVNRLVLCAKYAEQQIMRLYSGELDEANSSVDMDSLFQPNLDIYDILIHIDPAFIMHENNLENEIAYKDKLQLNKNQDELTSESLLIGIDPISMYVNDLRELLSQFGLVFRDATRNHLIAIVWNPSAFLPNSFNMTKCNAMFPLEHQHCQVLPNIFEILRDINDFGKGLIQRVELQSKSQKLSNMSLHIRLKTIQ